MIKKHTAWLLPVFCFFLALLATRGTFLYWEGDTLLLNKIAENTQSPGYLVFIGWPLSLVLHALYLLTDAVNWFGLFLCGCVSVSFFILNKAVVKRILSGEGKSLPFFLALSFCANLYALFHLDFTAESFLLMAAVLVWFFFDTVKHRSHWAVMAILILCSYCLRFFTMVKFTDNTEFSIVSLLFKAIHMLTYPNASIIAIGIAFPLFVSFFLQRKTRIKTCVFSAMLVLILVFCSVFSLAMNKKYNINEFLSFHTCIVKNLDYSSFEDLSQENMQNAGFTENDCKLLFSWIYGDRTVFTQDKLLHLYEEVPQTQKMNLSLGLPFSFAIYQWTRIMLWVFLVLWCLMKHTKRSNLLYFGNMIFTFVAAFSLFVLKRVMLRLLIPIYFIGFCYALCITVTYGDTYENNRKKLKKAFLLLIPATVFAACIVTRVDSTIFSVLIFITDILYILFVWLGNKDKIVHALLSLGTACLILLCCVPLIQRTAQHHENLTKKAEMVESFLASHENAILLCALNECDKPVKLWNSQLETVGLIEALGGWMFLSPYYDAQICRYGLEEYRNAPITALFEDNVYLILAEEKTMQIVAFFEEHYPEKEFTVSKIAEPNIYQFTFTSSDAPTLP